MSWSNFDKDTIVLTLDVEKSALSEEYHYSFIDQGIYIKQNTTSCIDLHIHDRRMVTTGIYL